MKKIYFEKVKPYVVRLWLEDEHICYLRFPSVTMPSDMNKASFVNISRYYWFDESESEKIQMGWTIKCANKDREVWLRLGIFPVHYDTPLSVRVCKTDRANAAHDGQAYTDLSLILERLFKELDATGLIRWGEVFGGTYSIRIHRK